MNAEVAAVVIGRNEGERLVRCLASLTERAAPVLYVDSGSTDASVAAAREAGAQVVELDMSLPFTAARARNAGLLRLGAEAPPFVQVIDGDCEMRDSWIGSAAAFLKAHPRAAAVAGRLRERFPEVSVWNRLADMEWEGSSGEVDAIGGIALLRKDAVAEVGGYREDLIAGEEPEMCLRLRQAGWTIHRIEAEMAWHDAAMTRIGQWWRRTTRAGHAFAEGAWLHGASGYMRAETRRALLWGAGLPTITVFGLIATPWALLLLLAYPAQMLRLRLKGMSGVRAVFLVLGRLPEAQGVLRFHLDRLRGRKRGLIEYK